MTATQTVVSVNDIKSSTDKMKEALRRMAAAVGEEVIQAVEERIDELEETASARKNRIDELEGELQEMIPFEDVEDAKREDENFVRGMAHVHRLLKSGKSSEAIAELEYHLDRNCDKWRMYVS